MTKLWEIHRMTIVFNNLETFVNSEVVRMCNSKAEALKFYNEFCKDKESDTKTPIPLERIISVYLIRDMGAD